MSLIESVQFLRPWWLVLLIPSFAVLFFLWRTPWGANSWSQVIAPKLLKAQIGQSKPASKVPLILLGLVWLVTTIALAGPSWQKTQIPTAINVDPLVMVLSLNNSMYSQDLEPSRLTQAKHKIINLLRKRKDGLTALVVYAENAYTVVPLTSDTQTLNNMLSSVAPDIMPSQGNNPLSGIKLAKKLIDGGGLGNGTILLITDNVPNQQVNKIAKQMNSELKLKILGVGTLAGSVVPLSTGLMKNLDGSPVISKLGQTDLKSLAAKAKGQYQQLSLSDNDLDTLLPLSRANNLQKSSQKFLQWQDDGIWLVLLILPFAALGARKSWLLIALCLILPWPHPARAISWSSLWYNQDQQGAKQLSEGKTKEAVRLFQSAEWKAQALFADKQYNQSAKILSQLNSAKSSYNRGNALAHDGQFKKALTAYEQAFKADPTLKQAKENSDKIREYLKNRQAQKKHSQSNEEKKTQNKSSSSQNPSSQKKQQPSSGENKKQNIRKNSASNKINNTESKSSNNQQDSKVDTNKVSSSITQENHASTPPKEPLNKKNTKLTQQQRSDAQKEDNQPSNSEKDKEKEKTKAQSSTSIKKNRDYDLHKKELDNWLREIPDNPGELLRRKFLLEKQENDKKERYLQW